MKLLTRPRRSRSSGTWATPISRIIAGSLGLPASTRTPLISKCPSETGRIPESASMSSLWPLPETPAMPTISPARSSRETWSRRSMPCRSVTVRPSARTRVRPGSAAALSTSTRTLRPTISSASSSRLVSAVLRSATILPPRITETLSVMAMISRSLWVIRTTVTPRRRSESRIRNSWSVSWGVSTPVGSSRIRISAPR